METLEVKDLVVKYNNKKEIVTALNGISFKIEKGDFTVIIGESGSGKSTLARTLSMLKRPVSGYIYFDGKTPDESFLRDGKIAYISQNLSLYPKMTIFDNIAYPLKVQMVPFRERTRRVKEIAKALEIEHLLTRKPAQISLGQQQRVAIARAMIKRPELYIFDEPFSHLDSTLKQKLRLEFLNLRKYFQTISIFITQDPLDALTLGTQVMVMEKGEIVQKDTPLNVYNNPVNKTTSLLIRKKVARDD